jgi:hypothetical protein
MLPDFGVQVDSFVASPFDYCSYSFGYSAANYSGGDLLTRFAFPAEPRAWTSCHRNHETVTIPSEDGGTREVSVTRC